MKKRSIVLFYVFIVALSSCRKEIAADSMDAQVFNNSVIREPAKYTYQVDDLITSSCIPEVVHVTGDVNVQINSIEISNGRQRYTVHIQYFKVAGVGLTTGYQYFFKGQQTDFFNISGYEERTENLHARFLLKSPGAGKGTSFIIDYTFRRAYDSQGYLIFEKGGFVTYCK